MFEAGLMVAIKDVAGLEDPEIMWVEDRRGELTGLGVDPSVVIRYVAPMASPLWLLESAKHGDSIS